MLPSTRFSAFRLLDLGPPPITAPSSLAVTGSTTSQISLSWTNGDVTKDIEVFEDGSFLTTLAAGTTTYNRTGLSANVGKSYKVRHVDGLDTSAFSNTVSGYTKPNAPTSFTAVEDGTDQVILNWTDSHVLDVHVYVGGVYLTTVPAGHETFTHSSLSPNTTYNYDIYHINAGGLSAAASDSATTESVGPTGAPSGLAAENWMVGQVKLDWTVTDGTSETRIYRDGGLIGTVGTGVATFTDTGRTVGVAYSYKVRHYKDFIESADSNTANITTMQISSEQVTGASSTDLFQFSWAKAGTEPSGMYAKLVWTDDLANTTGQTINPTSSNIAHNVDVSTLGYDVHPAGTHTVNGSYTITLHHSNGNVIATKSNTFMQNVNYSA